MARPGLRHFIEHRLGAPGRALLAWRTRGQAEALLARRGLTAPAARIAKRLDDHVRRGPFAGMHYPRRRGDIVHTAKLVGAYESELHGAIERLIARAPTLVVNVGSGDGYYVVGIARRLHAARIVAVDPDPLAQRACARTARINGVGPRIRAIALVDSAALEEVIASDTRLRCAGVGGVALVGRDRAADGVERALIIVDCEGYEDDLLDPVRAPSLAYADLLVETHDFARAGVSARLTERFGATHHVERIEVAARDVTAFPDLAAEPADVARGLLDEFRHMPQSWLVLTARAAAP
jgi:hypothetical protein